MTATRYPATSKPLRLLRSSILNPSGVFVVGGWDYVVAVPSVENLSGNSLARKLLSESHSGDRLQLLTVVHVDADALVSVAWLKSKLQKARETDDVFRDEFLQGVLFITETTKNIHLDDDARKYLEDLGAKWIEAWSGVSDLCPGPHVHVDGILRPVLRLYSDTHNVFVHSLRQDESGRFYQLRLQGQEPGVQSVAVPSRLANSLSETPKLAGMRIAVKDIFQIKDIPNTVCNKAWHELYQDNPPEATAACVEMLRKMGATIVGTTKLASFAATEEPVECIDYQAPWNPRADGYQSPAGSSSGSGAAIGAYEWLDFAIGSDTSGSGRRPGHWNGCIAMRPTHGALPVDGYIPSFPRFDVPTFFGRELVSSREFASAWYGSALTPPRITGNPAIIYPMDYMAFIKNETQLALIDKFTEDLETSLGVACDRVSIHELWSSNPPAAAVGMVLEEYMKDVARNSFFHDDYHNFAQFRKDYTQQFGRQPYVSPPVRWQWDLSSKISGKERDIAVEKLDVYKEWFLDVVMQRGKRDTLVLIPIENISPRYRDDPPLPPFNPVGVPNLFISPILGSPELTVPIGTSPFDSKVTGNVEHLPVGISVIAEPGRDLDLFDTLYKCLTEAGRPTGVKAGRTMFA